MNSEGAGGTRNGLSAAAGVVAMLAVIAVVVGGGFLLTRQVIQTGISSTTPEVSSQDRVRRSGRSDQEAIAPVAAPEAKGGPPATTASREVPEAVGTIRPLRDDQQPAAAESGVSSSRVSSSRVIPASGALPGTVATERAKQATEAGTSDASTSLPDDSGSGSENGAGQLNLTIPLPVALPTSAMLGGVLIPIGPDGVRSAGADAFAHTLLVRAQQRRPDLVEDTSLRDVAKLVLTDQLGLAQQRGAPTPARVQRGSVTVQVEVVATLPDTQTAALQAIGGSVGVVGVATGISHRVEPNYLPDLVAVAAVAYR
jgi:hypothetical protein